MDDVQCAGNEAGLHLCSSSGYGAITNCNRDTEVAGVTCRPNVRAVSPGKLKEYYEIVGESRPLSGFFPAHADFFTEIHFLS